MLIRILLLLLFCNNSSFAENPVDSSILEYARNATVTINARIAVSAYRNVGSWVGTGFISSKHDGFIITNAHVTGRASVGTYFVTFFNGQQSEAKLAFYDPFVDFAILTVDPREIPKLATEIAFADAKLDAPKLNDEVLVIGNTEAQGFSFHTGNISTLYEINGEMPQCSYVINLNSAGGASGSAVINPKTKKAIGVLYGGGKTYVFSLHAAYVQYALESMKNKQMPIRNHCGIITELYSLDSAEKHRHFPKKIIEEYLLKFPDTRNMVVSVRNIIAGSVAENILQPGDIIWAIKGEKGSTELGGSLIVLDMAMNNARDSSVTLELYRNGELLTKTVPLYDVNKNKIERMVDFAGALFFESDDFTSSKTGIPLGALSIMNVNSGSSFSSLPVPYIQDNRNFYRLVVKSISEQAVGSLDELIKFIPNIINAKQKFINVRFKNYQPYMGSFQSQDGSFVSAQEDLVTDIVLDNIDAKPRVLKYDNAKMEWIAEDVVK